MWNMQYNLSSYGQGACKHDWPCRRWHRAQCAHLAPDASHSRKKSDEKLPHETSIPLARSTWVAPVEPGGARWSPQLQDLQRSREDGNRTAGAPRSQELKRFLVPHGGLLLCTPVLEERSPSTSRDLEARHGSKSRPCYPKRTLESLLSSNPGAVRSGTCSESTTFLRPESYRAYGGLRPKSSPGSAARVSRPPAETRAIDDRE